MPAPSSRGRARGRPLAIARAYAALLRRLGPWSSPDSRPRGASRRSITVPAAREGDRPFEAWIYTPVGRAPMGAYLICPGLHYAGPSDPRLDRFASILASAGMLVLAPFLPDFTSLRVDPRVAGDLDRAFGALLALEELPSDIKPGIFSISFGSLPTLRVAASEARRDQVGAAVIFGGYADWGETIRFCLGQGGSRKRDPLNQPVVLMNLIDDLPDRPGTDPAPLLAAWRRYVEATWGRAEMKEDARWRPIAETIGAELDPALRPLFRRGVGLDPGAFEACSAALERQAGKQAYLDPRPELAGLRCPIALCHGADDDVIPHTELEVLARAMPPHVPLRKYVTGLYHHTGTAALADLLKSIPVLAKEVVTLAGILRAIVRSSRMPR